MSMTSKLDNTFNISTLLVRKMCHIQTHKHKPQKTHNFTSSLHSLNFLHCNLFILCSLCRKHFVKWEREIQENIPIKMKHKKFKKSSFSLTKKKKESFEEILSGNGSSKEETLRGETLLNAICFQILFHDISFC